MSFILIIGQGSAERCVIIGLIIYDLAVILHLCMKIWPVVFLVTCYLRAFLVDLPFIIAFKMFVEIVQSIVVVMFWQNFDNTPIISLWVIVVFLFRLIWYFLLFGHDISYILNDIDTKWLISTGSRHEAFINNINTILTATTRMLIRQTLWWTSVNTMVHADRAYRVIL